MSVMTPLERIGFEILDINVTSITDEEVNRVRQLVYDHKLVVF